MSEDRPLKQALEAVLLAANAPLSLERLLDLFADDPQSPDADRIRQLLEELTRDYQGRGMELREVASGWRVQVRADYAPWVARLFEERPPRYSRALLETLAIIAYRQPVTRGEIEEIRGVTASGNIIKTLQEREWIRHVGHREVPGRPALYATTRHFLDYFGLRGLDELPTLAALKALDDLEGSPPVTAPEPPSPDPRSLP